MHDDRAALGHGLVCSRCGRRRYVPHRHPQGDQSDPAVVVRHSHLNRVEAVVGVHVGARDRARDHVRADGGGDHRHPVRPVSPVDRGRVRVLHTRVGESRRHDHRRAFISSLVGRGVDGGGHVVDGHAGGGHGVATIVVHEPQTNGVEIRQCASRVVVQVLVGQGEGRCPGREHVVLHVLR